MSLFDMMIFILTAFLVALIGANQFSQASRKQWAALFAWGTLVELCKLSGAAVKVVSVSIAAMVILVIFLTGAIAGVTAIAALPPAWIALVFLMGERTRVFEITSPAPTPGTTNP